MTLKFAKIASLCTVAAAAAFSLWARTALPDAPIATHFDLQGHVNGYMPRDAALLFGPCMGLALSLFLLWLLPAIMPKAASLSRSSEAYGILGLAVVVFVCGLDGMLIASALGVPLDRMRLSLLGAGLLFIVIGNYLPKMRFNYVAGVKNPWTLSSEAVWDKTHRMCGRLFVAAGLVTLAAALFVPLPYAVLAMLVMVIGAAIGSHLYAYTLARRSKLA